MRRPNITKFWSEFYEGYNYEDISLGVARSLTNLLCTESQSRNAGNIFGDMSKPGGIFIGAINEEGKD